MRPPRALLAAGAARAAGPRRSRSSSPAHRRRRPSRRGRAAAAPPRWSSRRVDRTLGARPAIWRLAARASPASDEVVLISTCTATSGTPGRSCARCATAAAIRGIDLWVIPTYNPDGLAAAHPQERPRRRPQPQLPLRWADLDGNYESGPRAAVGARDPGDDAVPARDPAATGSSASTSRSRRRHRHQGPDFARRVARKLNLPRKAFDCGGVCHGTMTMWFNHHFAGAALTVEYGARPSRRAGCAASGAPRSSSAVPSDRPRRVLPGGAQRPSKTGFSLATNAPRRPGGPRWRR